MALVVDCEWCPAIELGDPRWPAIEEMAEKREQHPNEFQATCCPPFCSLVAVGLFNTHSAMMRIGYDARRLDAPPDSRDVPCDGEVELLRWTHRILDGFYRGDRAGLRLVTFNGLASDFPVIWHRSAVLGVQGGATVNAVLGAKPWESHLHVDLCNALRMNGSRYSLRAYALAYGLPDPKAHGDGSDVADQVARRDGKALLDYLTGDLLTTALLAELTVPMLP